VKRSGRVDDGGWPVALSVGAAGAIARQRPRETAPGEVDPPGTDDFATPPRRRRGEGNRWIAPVVRRRSPVDLLLALAVVVLLAAMVVVAVALTNHV
jgi:hypothetical protein